MEFPNPYRIMGLRNSISFLARNFWDREDKMDKWQEYEAAKRKLRQREQFEDFDF